jgi:hypothetical protein
VNKLRDLVKQEESVRQKRKEHFFSTDFVMGEPGTLFPHSWTPSFALARGCKPMPEGRPQGALQVRPDFQDRAAILVQRMLKTTAPIFDKSTEEGLRFRIYRLGSLEVRTTQELEAEEIVGVVFSIKNQTSSFALKTKALEDSENIAKVTEYVERDFVLGGDQSKVRRRYYIVFETEQGHTLVVERTPEGNFGWVENPDDLDDRNSLAKVTRTQKSIHSVTVQDLRAYQTQLEEYVLPSSKRFSQAVFGYVVRARA